jgi:hypothetical protein
MRQVARTYRSADVRSNVRLTAAYLEQINELWEFIVEQKIGEWALACELLAEEN